MTGVLVTTLGYDHETPPASRVARRIGYPQHSQCCQCDNSYDQCGQPAGQAVRVLRAEDPLDHRQQRRKLVAGRSRIAGLAGPAGKVTPSGQDARVL